MNLAERINNDGAGLEGAERSDDYFSEEVFGITLKIKKTEDGKSANGDNYTKIWFMGVSQGAGLNRIVTRYYNHEETKLVDGKKKVGGLGHLKNLIRCVGLLTDGKVHEDFKFSELVGGNIIADVVRQYNNDQYFTPAKIRPVETNEQEIIIEAPKEQVAF